MLKKPKLLFRLNCKAFDYGNKVRIKRETRICASMTREKLLYIKYLIDKDLNSIVYERKGE